MHAPRDNPSIPAWRSDEQGSPEPPELEPAYFDRALQAWVLSRHRDILAVLRDERAVPASVKSGEAIAPANEDLRVRTAGSDAGGAFSRPSYGNGGRPCSRS